MIRQLRKAGEKSIPGAKNLNQLLMTLRRDRRASTHLTKFILNSVELFNGFDHFGHYLRTQLRSPTASSSSRSRRPAPAVWRTG